MKRIIFLFTMFFGILTTSFCQLVVSTTGNVGIGISGSPVSKFALGGVGTNYAQSYFKGDGYVMQIQSLGKNSNMSSSSYGIGLLVKGTPSSAGGHIGVHSSIYDVTYSSGNSFAVGVQGDAGNGQNGYNYGVVGSLYGYNNGAGVFGTVNYSNSHSTYIPGRYAGYFDGNVLVDGNLRMYFGHVYHMGDENFMQNKEPMGNMLSRVLTLNPVAYKLNGAPDSTFALKGQEVQNIFPQLVSTDYDINYSEMVPILVKAIKELQNEIDVLQSLVNNSRSVNLICESQASIKSEPMYSQAILMQNKPNPFSEQTVISFTLPKDSKNAFIYIYDMAGKMVKQLSIDSTMNSVVVNGYELSAGLYIYSLVINGCEIDSKRMILSK